MSNRSLQQIFDAVIDAGLYFGNALNTHSYMCHALSGAYQARVIDYAECDEARSAVQEYLRHGDKGRGYGEALEGYLLRHFDPNDWGYLPEGSIYWNFTKLYRNWDGRPIAEKRTENE